MKKDQMPKNGSIYLEAFPFIRTVVDICDLEADERGFARVLMDHLMQGGGEITFQSHTKSQDKLHHIFFESRNWERQGGQRCTALGFPLVLSKQNASVQLAPIFIWPVGLDPDPHRPHHWTIRSMPGRVPVLNPLLFPAPDGLPLPPWSPERPASREDIQAYGKELAEAMGWTWQDSWAEPFPTPPMEVWSDLAQDEAVLPCMVLGDFKPAFSGQEEEGFWAPSEEHLDLHPHRQAFERSLFNPFQAQAWEHVQTGKTTLLENEDPETTLDWVINLLHQALCNGERTLVLSDRLGRLAQIQHQLSGLKLDAHAFLLKDPYQDAYLLAELLKARLDKETALPAFSKDDFNMLLAKCQRHKEKLDKACQALQKPLLGSYTWTDLVGLFLRSSVIEGKELLSSQLTTQDFQFTYQEYETCKKVIAQSIPLYNRINTLKHPLTALHPSHFLHKEKEAALQALEQQIQTQTTRIEALHHDVLRQTDAYALKLNDHFEQNHLSLSARLNHLMELASDYSHKFGEGFERGSTGPLKKIFNKRAKAIGEARDDISQAYLALARYHQEHSLFDFSFLSPTEARNMANVKASLESFEKILNDWRQRIRDRVMEEAARLNRQTVFPELGLQETIAQLEDRIDATLAEFNDSRIYSEVVEANMLTIPKKQKFLDSLLEKLETTRLNLRDFDPFYDWQSHWLQLSDPEQRLIRALIKVKPQNWVSAFESWYFHHCLNRHFTDDLPTDDQALKVFYESWTALQEFLPALIQTIWLERQQKAIKTWKRSAKTGFQSWLGKNKLEGTPAQWFGPNWEALHNLYPIWLMPDGLAPLLYSAETAPELDWVIVWEHQEFEPAIWQALAQKVKHWVVIGSGQGKLEAFLREKGWPSYPLRDLPAARVYQTALDQDPSEKASGTEIQLLTANGLYDPSTQTNEAEAQEIVRLLNEIRPTPARTYPSVAILTLTVAQRDLIAQYLLQIKQRNLQGSEKIRSLERNRLAVLHIDEVLGSSFEQFILSTTLGPVNAQGALPGDIASFESPDWNRAARALLQSPAASKVVVHSFTEAQLADRRLHAFQQVLRQLTGKTGVPEGTEPSAGEIPEFHREVSALLEGYFDTWHFRLKPDDAHYKLPIILRQDGDPAYATAIIPDLFSANLPVTSYTWEWKVREHLTHQGYPVQNTWSVLLWRNPRQEARKLAGRIIAAYNRLAKEGARQTEEEEGSSET